MLVRPALHLVGAAILLAWPPAAGAQIPGTEPEQEESRSCELIENQWVFIRVLGENNRNSYVSGPLEARCEGGIRIQADSAVIYEASGYTQLFDNVMFEDPEKQLTSDRANYFSEDRRLIALGRGRVVDKVRQSVITGDTIVYSRARPPFRMRDILSVRGGDPHAILFPPERAPQPTAAAPEVTTPDSTVADTLAGPRPGAEPPGDSTVVVADAIAADSVSVPEPGAAVDTAGTVPDGDSPDPPAADTTGPAADPLAIDSAGGQPPPATEFRAPSDSMEVPADAEATPGDSIAADVRPPPAPRPRRVVPYDVDAESFMIVGDREFVALGDVVIRRDSLEAFGDSLRFDQVSGDIVLTGDARIEEATFDLTGEEVRLGETPEGVQEVRAVGDAVLLGDQVDLTAPEIRILLVDGALDVLVATSRAAPPPEAVGGAGEQRPGTDVPARGGRPTPEPTQAAGADSLAEESGPQQARAITEDFVLTGDSIEVIAPGEMLETVTAVGAARGESEARDSLNTDATPEVARRDWLEGHQITAYFEPLDSVPPPAQDTASEPPPVRIRSRPISSPGVRNRP
jgi:lipopolysaccharide export system protein LptA